MYLVAMDLGQEVGPVEAVSLEVRSSRRTYNAGFYEPIHRMLDLRLAYEW